MGTKSFIATVLASLPFLSQAQSEGIACWTMKGAQTKLAVVEGVLVVPDTIAAVDLRGAGAITLDCSAAIPNCLYYVEGTGSVAGLPSANVVCDGICDGLLLTDASGFYCPMDFTATDAMLRLTPRRDDVGEGSDFSQPCHETVFLPFDVDFVVPVDADGPMSEGWLQTAVFSGYDGNLLTFSPTYSDGLNANTPYLVRFSDTAYGTQILFCGQDKTVEESATIAVGGDAYTFVGTTAPMDESPTYFRYHRGKESYFVHTGDDKPMEPFRCFIVSADMDESPVNPTDSGEGLILRYVIVEGEATGIGVPNGRRPSTTCYDLQGRPSNGNGKGVHIVGGNKTIK